MRLFVVVAFLLAGSLASAQTLKQTIDTLNILSGTPVAVGTLTPLTSIASGATTSNWQSVSPQFNADGTLKEATKPGSSLVINDWKCTIQSKDGIRCDNTTDYCVKLKVRQKEFRKHIFGCVDKNSTNYPCNFSEIDPMHDGSDKSAAGQYQMFQYNFSTCGPHGVGIFALDE